MLARKWSCSTICRRACAGLVPSGATFVEGNVADRPLVQDVLKKHGVNAIIHFAGSTVVPESVEKPLRYYANNTSASRALIETASECGVRHFIFSSTAAVYESPKTDTVAETAPTDPASPYGRSKLMTEWMLRDAAHAGNIDYVILRYFNVAGADPKGRTGQSTPLRDPSDQARLPGRIGPRTLFWAFMARTIPRPMVRESATISMSAIWWTHTRWR